MFNKEIYQEWELHQDATQLEIKYKFFVKFVDILNVKSLIKNEGNNFQPQISDSSTIRNWQSYQLDKVANEFIAISSYKFPATNWFNSSDIFVKSIFMLANILLTLKTTNYKANDLEIYYEPVMFKLAQKILKPDILNEWVSLLSERVFNAKTNITDPLSLDITMNSKNITMVMWILENLCLAFKDIESWYKRLFAIKDVQQEEKSIYMNIMNHMIVYALSDFYIKLQQFGDNKKTFSDLYEWVLANIAKKINAGKFAVEAFKEIAIFISKVLLDGYIDKNDSIVLNFLDIVKVSSSKQNYDRISDLIFTPINKKEAELNNAQQSSSTLSEEALEEVDKMTSKIFGRITDEDMEDEDNKTTPLNVSSPFAQKNTSRLSISKFVKEAEAQENEAAQKVDASHINKLKDFDEVDENDDVQTIIDKKIAREAEKRLTANINKPKTIKLGDQKPIAEHEEWDQIIINSSSDNEGE